MTTIVIFLLVLSFLVFIHELGHYLAARHVGVRVESFSIGFPPRVWSKRVGDTEYMLSAIPLGGYVRLYGQNVDDEDPTDPQNYAAKTRLQRLYILVAGPAANLLLALIFMPLVFWMGTEVPVYLKEPAKISSVTEGSVAADLGLQAQDWVVSLNGQPTPTWQAVNDSLAQLGPGATLQIEYDRQGELLDASVPAERFQREGSLGWSPLIPPVVGRLVPDSPAAAAGLQPGDRILSINGVAITEWSQITQTVMDLEASYETPVPLTLEVDRNGAPWEAQLTPYLDPESDRLLLGMGMAMENRSFPVGEAITRGVDRLGFMIGATFGFIGQMLSGQGSMDDLGGPVRIGMVVGQAAENGWTELFFMMAVISLQLGIFNLLPIPALDGGHILMLGVEKLKGGPLSATLRERTQMLGFSVLLALMLFVTYNDLIQVVN